MKKVVCVRTSGDSSDTCCYNFIASIIQLLKDARCPFPIGGGGVASSVYLHFLLQIISPNNLMRFGHRTFKELFFVHLMLYSANWNICTRSAVTYYKVCEISITIMIRPTHLLSLVTEHSGTYVDNILIQSFIVYTLVEFQNLI
jgi:hypothetical protein